MFGYFLLFFLTGLAFMGISLPMIARKVKPNPWYGFRTPKTLRDPNIWYPANAYSGATLFVAGGLTSAAALVLALLPGMNKDLYVWLCLIVMLVGMAWSVIRSFQYLNKL